MKTNKPKVFGLVPGQPTTGTVELVSGSQILEMAAALTRGDYFRVDQTSGTIAWWPVKNLHPQIMGNKPADRRAWLREATGLKSPPYGERIWREIIAFLPDVTGGAS